LLYNNILNVNKIENYALNVYNNTILLIKIYSHFTRHHLQLANCIIYYSGPYIFVAHIHIIILYKYSHTWKNILYLAVYKTNLYTRRSTGNDDSTGIDDWSIVRRPNAPSHDDQDLYNIPIHVLYNYILCVCAHQHYLRYIIWDCGRLYDKIYSGQR